MDRSNSSLNILVMSSGHSAFMVSCGAFHFLDFGACFIYKNEV